MPQIREYPPATSLEDTDAFVIDREGTGSMYIEASDFAPRLTPGTYGDATHTAVVTVNADGSISDVTETAISTGTNTDVFQIGQAAIVNLTAPRGYLNNSGVQVTMDTIIQDPAGGVTLSKDMASLPNASAATQFYSPFTVYQIPTTGLWAFYWQAYVAFSKSAANNQQLTIEIEHWDSTGTSIYDSPGGNNFQMESPPITIFAGQNNNEALTMQAMLQCTEGDYVGCGWIGGDNAHTMSLLGDSTVFMGWRVG